MPNSSSDKKKISPNSELPSINTNSSTTLHTTVLPPINYSMPPPVITNTENIIFPSSTTTVLVSWTSKFTRFYVSVKDLTTNNIIYSNNKLLTLKVSFAVMAGHSYLFSVNGTANTTIVKSISPADQVNFSVAKIIAPVCVAGSQEVLACSIANGIGTQTKTCNNNAYTLSSCALVSCNAGYSAVNGVCTPIVLTCSGVTTQICNITYGIGTQSRTCVNGAFTAFSSCTLVSCNPGYESFNGVCSPIVLTCIGDPTQSCTMANGTGTQSRTCVGGVYTEYSTCSVVTCNSGFTASTNSCVSNNVSSSNIASSLTYHGVTIHFSQDHIIGKFANGEPWIIGPVSITGIDKPSVPVTTAMTGGAMINPIPGDRLQGFSPRYTATNTAHYYDPTLDVSLHYPFTVNAGDSLIVARAIGPEAENDGGAYVAYVDSVIGFIILDQAPPEGSFRPGLYGKDHTVRFNKNNIDYSVLKNLPPVAATPTQAYIESDARLPALPWWEWTKEWTGTFIRPLANCGTGEGTTYRSQYGREAARKWSQVALWLNTNNSIAVKEKTMIQTIQVGIDLASYFANGGSLMASGGHEVGRKFPLLLAAVALKDPVFLALTSDQNRFIEDQTTFIVQQSDVGRDVGSGIDAMYVQEDVGLADWGINHSWNPNKDDRRWSTDGIHYRYVQYPAMRGQVLAADLMGLRGIWNHPATFTYNERFTHEMGLDNPAFEFEAQMWNAYKPAADALRAVAPQIYPNGGRFNTKQLVSMATSMTGGQIRYTLDGTTPNSTSLLYTGPIMVGKTQTIFAMALKAGLSDSDITTATFIYSITPSADWNIKSVDSEDPDGYKAIYAFDNNPKTFWTTVWKTNTPPPHEISINLGSMHYNINGFRYLPRQDVILAGNIGKYEFYVSLDGVDWGTPVAIGEFSNTSEAKYVEFAAKSGQYIKLRSFSDTNGGPTTNMAEIELRFSLLEPIPENIVAPVELSSNGGNFSTAQSLTMSTNTIGSQIRYTIDGSLPNSTSLLYSGAISVNTSQTIRAMAQKSGMYNSAVNDAAFIFALRPSTDWSLKYVDSEDPDGYGALKAFDGDPKTFWHTEWRLNQPPPPHEIQINLGSIQSITGFRYLPRQDTSSNGNVGQYEFYVSADGVNWGTPVTMGIFTNTKNAKEVQFATKSGQYIRLIGLSSVNGGPYISMAEIELRIAVPAN